MRKIENYNQCQNHGLNCQSHELEGLKDFTDLTPSKTKKSVSSSSSVRICDSDNIQAEINQYLTQLVK